MISGGNATVFVSDMDRAVRFYTEVLGLKLTNRFGDSWATVEAGKGADHRAASGVTELPPLPEPKAASCWGLKSTNPSGAVISRLRDRGAPLTGAVITSEAGNFFHFDDPDGNEMYLWEVSPDAVSRNDAGGKKEEQLLAR